LAEIGHPIALKVAFQLPRFPKMKCQTDLNDEDCGIFCMFHMETFMGGPISKYDCGLGRECEEHKSWIVRLRTKYATKILTSDLNINKPIVLQEADEFSKIPAKQRKQTLYDAFQRKEERMQLI